MKKSFKKYVWVFVLLAAAAAAAVFKPSAAEAEPSPFDAMRKAMPAKLDLLRERVDAAGGRDLSLALVLSSQNKDARLVSSTVLVYQNYPRERKLAVLLAAAVRYNENVSLMQRVEDKSLKQALAQAPEEMAGITGMFETVDNMLKMTPQQLKTAVAAAQKLDMQRLQREAVTRDLQYRLAQQGSGAE